MTWRSFGAVSSISQLAGWLVDWTVGCCYQEVMAGIQEMCGWITRRHSHSDGQVATSQCTSATWSHATRDNARGNWLLLLLLPSDSFYFVEIQVLPYALCSLVWQHCHLRYGVVMAWLQSVSYCSPTKGVEFGVVTPFVICTVVIAFNRGAISPRMHQKVGWQRSSEVSRIHSDSRRMNWHCSPLCRHRWSPMESHRDSNNNGVVYHDLYSSTRFILSTKY